jgi:hypothetical protein
MNILNEPKSSITTNPLIPNVSEEKTVDIENKSILKIKPITYYIQLQNAFYNIVNGDFSHLQGDIILITIFLVICLIVIQAIFN